MANGQFQGDRPWSVQIQGWTVPPLTALPPVTSGLAARIAVNDVLKEFGDAAMAKFVDHAKGDPKLLRRLEKLLDDER